MSQQITTYIQLQVKNRDRVTALFRAILIIPVAILADSFNGYDSSHSYIAGLLFFPEIQGGRTLSRGLPLVKWFLAISLYVIGTVVYWNRVYGYAFTLVTDEYPSFTL